MDFFYSRTPYLEWGVNSMSWPRSSVLLPLLSSPPKRHKDTELCYFILHINDTIVFHLNECSLYRIVCATVNLYPEPFHSMVLLLRIIIVKEILINTRLAKDSCGPEHEGQESRKENLCFSGTNQKPERRRPFGTGLVRNCPQGLFSPFFTFLCSIYIFPPV